MTRTLPEIFHLPGEIETPEQLQDGLARMLTQEVATDPNSDQAQENLRTLGHIGRGSLLLIARAFEEQRAPGWTYLGNSRNLLAFSNPQEIDAQSGLPFYTKLSVGTSASGYGGYIHIEESRIHAQNEATLTMRICSVPDPALTPETTIFEPVTVGHEIYYDTDKVDTEGITLDSTKDDIDDAKSTIASALPFVDQTRASLPLPSTPPIYGIDKTPLSVYIIGAKRLVAILGTHALALPKFTEQ